jgi:hypothetical protein
VKPDSPWGVSEKLSELCKDNFADAGSGSMGMRLDELANSSFLGGEERKEDKSNFRIPFNGYNPSATRRARGNLFWVIRSVAFRNSVLD